VWINTKVKFKRYLLYFYIHSLKRDNLRSAAFINHFFSRKDFGPSRLGKAKNNEAIRLRVDQIKSSIQHQSLEIPSKNELKMLDFSNAPECLTLFIVPNSSQSITSDTLRNLAASYAKNIGVCGVIDGSGNVLFGAIDFKNKLTADDLLVMAKNIKINIFFELHTLLSETYNEIIKVFNCSKSLGIKFFIVCFDIWRDSDVALISSWTNSNTVFLHMDNVSAEKLKERFPLKRFHHWFFVGHEIRPNHSMITRDSIYFSGNISTHDRRIWLLNLYEICDYFGLQKNILLFTYRDKKERLDYVNFLLEMQKSRFILSLSQKSITHTLITFRSIESLALGCVLFQQELPTSKPLSKYFVPYVDYLPFCDEVDLAALVWIACNDANLLRNIGEKAKIKWSEHYSSELLWRSLARSFF